jgi:hypothetical protein
MLTDGRTDMTKLIVAFFAILSSRLKTKAGSICNTEICVFDSFWCNVFEAIVLLIITYNITNIHSSRLRHKPKKKSVINKIFGNNAFLHNF